MTERSMTADREWWFNFLDGLAEQKAAGAEQPNVDVADLATHADLIGEYGAPMLDEWWERWNRQRVMPSGSWSAMATAPKDGTCIELLLPNGELSYGRWIEDRRCMAPSPNNCCGDGWACHDSTLPLDDEYLGWRFPTQAPQADDVQNLEAPDVHKSP